METDGRALVNKNVVEALSKHLEIIKGKGLDAESIIKSAITLTQIAYAEGRKESVDGATVDSVVAG